MFRRIIAVLLACLFVQVSAAHAAGCERTEDTVFINVNIVDVEHDRIRPNRILVITDGRIAREYAFTERAAQEARKLYPHRVEGAGAYLMPGLWDMHVHTLWDASVVEPFFSRFLQSGVTSVRDMGGDLIVAKAARADLAACRLSGPHIWYPGPFLDGPEPVDPALSIALSTPDEGRAAVRRLKAEGVDFLKVYSLMRLDVLKAVTEEAALQHLDVVGHFPANGNIADAARVGLSDIEHLAIEIGGYCPSDAHERCGSIFDELIKTHVAQTPTLIARETSTRLGKEDFVEPSQVTGLPIAVQKYWRGERTATKAKATPEWLASRETSLVQARWMTQQLSLKGAIVLAGSDAGTAYVLPGSSLHDELDLLVQSGLTNGDALRAATVTPARVMKRSDMGVIKTGYIADLVLLRDNPLSDVNNVRHVEAVFVDGRQVFASVP